MSIGFQEFDFQQFRTEIAKMSDAELVSLGRSLHSSVPMHAWTAQANLTQPFGDPLDVYQQNIPDATLHVAVVRPDVTRPPGGPVLILFVQV